MRNKGQVLTALGTRDASSGTRDAGRGTRLLAGIARRTRETLKVVRTIIGVPDYDRYLAHACQRHPDQKPLTRDEFLNERLTAKYTRVGSRCC